MRTQSIDTSPQAERILITMLRLASIKRRFRLIQSLSSRTLSRQNMPRDPREEAVRALSHLSGRHIAASVQAALARHPQWQEQPVDLAAIFVPVMDALERLGLACYLGGSIASSLHGMQQSAQDIDLVIAPGECDLQAIPARLHAVSRLLQDTYLLVDAPAIDALQPPVFASCRFSFIHLTSLCKVDLIFPFCSQGEMATFNTQMRELVIRVTLDERYPPLPLASAHEMIVWKLYRFAQDAATRTNGQINDAEWNDILGMLKVQGPALDLAVLHRWATAFHLEQALRQALEDAGSMMDARLAVPAGLIEQLTRQKDDAIS